MEWGVGSYRELITDAGTEVVLDGDHGIRDDGGYTHRGGLGLITGYVMLDLWWMKW
jgi:hypothetical protein